MKYGYFDDENKEYVITNPRTPVKWINYIGTIAFGGFVDHTGGSLICKGDPAINRITKYLPQLPSSDFKGETAYIRIKENNKYRIFSPYYVPTLDKYRKYECRIGLHYTRIISEFYNIRSEITIFIPKNSNQLIRDYRITNLSKKSLSIDLVPVVEYTHPNALMQFTNADWIPQTMQSELRYNEKGRKIIAQYAFMNKDRKINYFTSNHPISSFETDRKIFLGDNEYNSWQSPKSLQNKELSNYEALRGDNICALMHHLGTVKPGQTKRIITQLGQCEDIKKGLPAIKKYRNPKNVETALNEISGFWNDMLEKMQIKTPDKNMNTMLNIHNPRQCYITGNWSRYLSLYQLGFGARGIGFRDSSQDVLGILGLVPKEGKELIRKLLHVQNRNGSAMHQFNPITMNANMGDAGREEGRPQYYGDDHLWIILSVCEYLKETGDMKFLKDVIPFYDKDKNGQPVASGTVLEHLDKSISFTWNNTGKHGLPLLGFADWNDTVNLPEGAESFFIANLFGKALTEMIGLMEFTGDRNRAKKYKDYYNKMRDRVNKYGWDGQWYKRYFDHKGRPIGSKSNQQGKIFTNAQSWPVISGFAPTEKARKSLDSVYKHLNTKNGIKLSFPGYKKYDPEKGGVTTYPPGAKENGGIFMHANPWVMIAETIMKNGNRAFEYYNQINPAVKNDKIDEFECAPYNYPQNVLGDEHPQFGLARNSWLSGTASWTYQAGMKYILGIRPSYEGLIVDPCIPKEWNDFSIKRTFRNTIYHITIMNTDHVSKGIKMVIIDGKYYKGNVLPVFRDNKVHPVLIKMG